MKNGGLSGEGGGQFGSLDAFSGALVPHIYFAEGEGCCGSTERFRPTLSCLKRINEQ